MFEKSGSSLRQDHSPAAGGGDAFLSDLAVAAPRAIDFREVKESVATLLAALAKTTGLAAA
jgi:hypothetical protein